MMLCCQACCWGDDVVENMTTGADDVVDAATQRYVDVIVDGCCSKKGCFCDGFSA